MAESKNTPGSKPGEGDVFKEFMRRLESGERIGLDSLNMELLKKYGTLNLAVLLKEKEIKVRSGGFEIKIKDKDVEVYREKKEQNNKTTYEREHVYISECLAKNIRELLFKMLEEYNYKVDNKWVTVKLPRSDRRVRQLQSWLLAVIRGFDVPLHDSPLIC